MRLPDLRVGRFPGLEVGFDYQRRIIAGWLAYLERQRKTQQAQQS